MTDAPENTIASLQLAADQGADLIEVDVRLSKDGVPILSHDPTLDKIVGRPIVVMSEKARFLTRLDGGKWFGSAFGGEKIPRLSSALRWARRRNNSLGEPVSLMIELKVDNDRNRRDLLARAVLRELRRFKLHMRSVLISFDEEILRLAVLHEPTVATGLLCDAQIPEAIKRAKTIKAQYLMLPVGRFDASLVGTVHDANLGLVAFTANSKREFQILTAANVDAIITDVPARLRKFFDQLDTVHREGEPHVTVQ